MGYMLWNKHVKMSQSLMAEMSKLKTKNDFLGLGFTTSNILKTDAVLLYISC